MTWMNGASMRVCRSTDCMHTRANPGKENETERYETQQRETDTQDTPKKHTAHETHQTDTRKTEETPLQNKDITRHGTKKARGRPFGIARQA
eukprot:1369943-Rhodomonas_salina.1